MVLCSRSQEFVDEAVQSLSGKHPSTLVKGTVCDVSDLGALLLLLPSFPLTALPLLLPPPPPTTTTPPAR